MSIITNYKVNDSDIASLFCDLTQNQTVYGVKTFSSSPILPTTLATENSNTAASTSFVNTAISNAFSSALGSSGSITKAINAAVKLFRQNESPGCYLVNGTQGCIPIYSSVHDLTEGGHMFDSVDYVIVMPSYNVQLFSEIDFAGFLKPTSLPKLENTTGSRPIIRQFEPDSGNLTKSIKLFFENEEVNQNSFPIESVGFVL